MRIKWQELFYFLDTGQHHPMPATKMMKNIIRDYAIIALGVYISKNKITAFTALDFEIGDKVIPIGRAFKEQFLKSLEN
ncbi:MAG: hypothetical protein SH808_05845 [Saprospiraceae bacterium]|nr:hypothetical protein [Saprospiraceae bacterium]